MESRGAHNPGKPRTHRVRMPNRVCGAVRDRALSRLHRLAGHSERNERLAKEDATMKDADMVGAGAPTRTGDLLITNQLLYQLSYTGLGGTRE